jgi:hypothetical protein
LGSWSGAPRHFNEGTVYEDDDYDEEEEGDNEMGKDGLSTTEVY